MRAADGRACFYPAIGYERDAKQACEYQAAIEEDEISSDEEIPASKDASFYDVVHSPPLYNRTEHYHPWHTQDGHFEQFMMIHDYDKEERAKDMVENMMAIQLRRTAGGNETLAGTRQEIAHEALKLIESNRCQLPVSQALKSAFVLETCVLGMNEGASKRCIQVPGNLPLAALHDRVLCPAFGWTRGFHDCLSCPSFWVQECHAAAKPSQ
jgi:hypothetical protein